MFAIACVQGDKECLEEKETTCTMMVTFLLLDDDPSVGVCWKLRNHIECMNDAADECQEDLDPKIKEGLKNLEEYLGENCTNISERAVDETVECETTDDDLTECIFDFLANTLSSS
ncbi:hypothetical protein CEXT_664021 [Caerostris extrusa]|uniref:DUF19 domain-containing protein n=1 Tax=Caerostris extrusa TaxID=172846 RepID=A0AAV4SQ82_CAEEX|nr:hypothetical protein CEXT_664021 [Caerostris extrusa]